MAEELHCVAWIKGDLGSSRVHLGEAAHRDTVDASSAVAEGSKCAGGSGARSIGRAGPPFCVHAGDLRSNPIANITFLPFFLFGRLQVFALTM